MKVSIRDVAERAGTGRMTVSNVLNGREGRVSSAMRSRVWQAVEELGYVPVASPISQKKRQPTRTIGVVFDTFNPDDHALGADLFNGMVEACREQDYDLLLGLRPPRQWNGAQEEIALLDGRADCFIFMSSAEHSRDATLSDLVAHERPCVVAFRRDVPSGVATVDADHEAAMELCVEHLVQLGHERIAFIGGNPTRNAGHRREEGFRHSIQSRGLIQSDEWIRSLGKWLLTEAEANDLANHLIELGATAAVCAADWLAAALMNALRAKGVRVPEDISLTGVDDIWVAKAHNITTITVPAKEMGRLCVGICDQMMQDFSSVPLHHILPVQLEIRASTAPPKR